MVRTDLTAIAAGCCPGDGWEFNLDMLSTLAGPAANEARRSIVIVWLTISAVWLCFWALIAALALAAADIRLPFVRDFATLFVLVVCPPIAIFGLFVIARILIGLTPRPFTRTLRR